MENVRTNARPNIYSRPPFFVFSLSLDNLQDLGHIAIQPEKNSEFLTYDVESFSYLSPLSSLSISFNAHRGAFPLEWFHLRFSSNLNSMDGLCSCVSHTSGRKNTCIECVGYTKWMRAHDRKNEIPEKRTLLLARLPFCASVWLYIRANSTAISVSLQLDLFRNL